MVEELDSLLHSGTEIATIYEELTKTLPADHLDFANVSEHNGKYSPCTIICGVWLVLLKGQSEVVKFKAMKETNILHFSMSLM